MSKLIFVVGATASGKSQVGVNLAKSFDGEIISCDSMQVYKDMNIGTAKVTREEMQGVPHHMIDIVNADSRFSVGEFASKADEIIEDILSRGKTPIVVGGTGLYVDGILYPMTFGGDKDNEVRADLERQLALYGKEYMHSLLVEIDPVDAEKIHPNNVKRVLRALEIYKTTGICKSNLHEKSKSLKYEVCMIALDVDRKVLYQRIDARVDKMFEMGLLNEVKWLLSNGIGFENQSMQAIGYKEFKEYFDGHKTLNETIDCIKQNSRNYAKRQLTWFRKYDFAKWYNPSDALGIERQVESFLK
ncbi:MAG: tRNA (adenosine(37)-N6)-dimethylallyltransferase MiaA, partial [Clostridia bacterium]|nr:tRNA (adenosine(37)-N6)-dimethylallyltransferase MiaA [Clostridia bacterium]